MALSSSQNHSVTKDDARRYIQNFRNSPTLESINGGFFGKDTLLAMLNQPGCIGIRYYYAKKDTGEPVLVLVGEAANYTSLSDGILGENPPLCPPWCATTNALDANL